MSSISYLFVPGSRPDRFEKAIGAGAGRVIIDLEDAVDPAEKGEARDHVCAALTEGLTAPVLIRVNGVDSPWLTDDLTALGRVHREHPGRLAGLVLPKFEPNAALERVRDAFGSLEGLELIGLIESAAGVQAVQMLAASGITRLAVGAIDLSVDLGSDISSPVLDVVYAQIVIASRVAGIASPIGSPPLDLRDAAGIEAEARRLKSMGLGGQLCIHPAQVEPLHTAFSPTAEEVEWAHRVIDSVGAAAQVDGQMVDKPVRDRAERIVALSARRTS